MAIVHASVITMEREEVLHDRTVVIERGVITDVARSAEVSTEGMEVIDASNRYVAPGLADMHVHMHHAGDALLFLANGVTTVRNMWGSPAHLAFQARVERGEVPGPRLVTTGPIVDGTGPSGRPIWPGSEALVEPGGAAALVEQQVGRGYQQVKAYSLLTRESLAALGRAARSIGVPLVGHCPEALTFEQAIDCGMTCFEHLTAIANGHLREGVGPRERLPVVDQVDMTSIRRLAARMASADVWNCPTLVVWQQLFQVPSEARSDPLLRYQTETTVRSWEPANDFRLRDMAPVWPQVTAAGRRHNRLLAEIVAVLHQEGAPLMVGTDTPNPYVVQGFSVHQELANLVRAGLSAYAAMSCATSAPARFLGESHVWGTVAPGRRADLLVLRSNPLRDLAALTDLEAVVVNGFLIGSDELRALLERRAAAARPEAGRPPTRITAVPEGAVIREGILIETYHGVSCGSLAFRHTRLPGDRVLVEERRARDGGEGRHTRLWLAPELTILRGTSTTTTSLGDERTTISWSDRGHYDVTSVAADGLRTQSRATDPMLPPAPALALSLIPQLVPWDALGAGAAVVDTIAVEQGTTAPVRLTFSAGRGDAIEAEVRVAVSTAGEDLQLRLTLGEGGTIRSIETTGIRGTHRLVRREDGPRHRSRRG